MNLKEDIFKARDYIVERIKAEKKEGFNIHVGLILGSGLGDIGSDVENPVVIDYASIPSFPVSTVEGHAGKLIIGTLEGANVIIMQGRFHYYEGYTMKQVTFPVRVMKALGVKNLIVTNACGGSFKMDAGDLMIIKDHINFMGDNPLIGQNDPELGVRFPDMSEPYSHELIELAKKVARKEDISVREGVYLGVTGPNYETPAEVRMVSILGADAVGMSTVPEVIVANHAGIKVLGISCVTDVMEKHFGQPLTHEEVLNVSNSVKPRFTKLVRGILREMAGK